MSPMKRQWGNRCDGGTLQGSQSCIMAIAQKIPRTLRRWCRKFLRYLPSKATLELNLSNACTRNKTAEAHWKCSGLQLRWALSKQAPRQDHKSIRTPLAKVTSTAALLLPLKPCKKAHGLWQQFNFLQELPFYVFFFEKFYEDVIRRANHTVETSFLSKNVKRLRFKTPDQLKCLSS